MKKQNLFLLINFFVMIIIGVLVIVYTDSAVLTEPKDKLFGQEITLEDETILGSIPLMTADSSSFSKIDKKWKAYDLDGSIIGFVYHGVIKNDFALEGSDRDYGYMALLIGIDLEGKVYVQYEDIYQSSWTVVGIQQYILETYSEGVDYRLVGLLPSYDADIVAGATENPATVSTDAIRSLVLDAIAIQYNIEESDPYADILGTETYVLTSDDTFTATDTIIDKLLVTDDGASIGYIYSLTGEGEYQAGSFDSIVLNVIFGTDDTILGFVFPEEYYNHTVGGFQDTNMAYLEDFVGFDMAELGSAVDAYDKADGLTTGASNTTDVVNVMLETLVLSQSQSSDPFVVAYGADYVIELDATFNPTNTDIAKSNVLQGTDVVGTVYHLSGTGEYQNGSFDSIVLVVYLDQNGEIIEMDLPLDTYNHTPTTFKDKNDTYIDTYIGLTLSEVVAQTNEIQDITAGASNTTALIDQLLQALVSEVN